MSTEAPSTVQKVSTPESQRQNGYQMPFGHFLLLELFLGLVFTTSRVGVGNLNRISAISFAGEVFGSTLAIVAFGLITGWIIWRCAGRKGGVWLISFVASLCWTLMMMVGHSMNAANPIQ